MNNIAKIWFLCYSYMHHFTLSKGISLYFWQQSHFHKTYFFSKNLFPSQFLKFCLLESWVSQVTEYPTSSYLPSDTDSIFRLSLQSYFFFMYACFPWLSLDINSLSKYFVQSPCSGLFCSSIHHNEAWISLYKIYLSYHSLVKKKYAF